MELSKLCGVKTIKNVHADFDLKRRLFDLGFLPNEQFFVHKVDKKRGIVVEICNIVSILDRNYSSFLEIE